MKLRITYNAPVVLTFTLAAVVVFALGKVLGPSFQQYFVAAPRLNGAASYVGLVGHILGHASWEHLIGNFMLILLLGPILEERHGSVSLLLMILVAALVTGLANLVLSSHGVLGASGIVFMMILLASTANIRGGGEIPLTFIAVAVIYMGGELVKAFHGDDGISHLAHLVGGSVGAVFGFVSARGAGAKRAMKLPGDPDVAKLSAKPAAKPAAKP